MTKKSNTSDFGYKRRKTLQLVGASAGTAVLSQSAGASETTTTEYAELGVGYKITSEKPFTGEFAYYELDTPKLFQVRFDGIHLNKFTPQEARDQFTADHPVVYNNEAKPTGGTIHGSSGTTLLPTKLGDALRPIKGVTLKTPLQEPRVVATMASSVLNITSRGNQVRVPAGKEREIRLDPSRVSIQVMSPDEMRFEEATVVPVIHAKNYGQQRVYE